MKTKYVLELIFLAMCAGKEKTRKDKEKKRQRKEKKRKKRKEKKEILRDDGSFFDVMTGCWKRNAKCVGLGTSRLILFPFFFPKKRKKEKEKKRKKT